MKVFRILFAVILYCTSTFSNPSAIQFEWNFDIPQSLSEEGQLLFRKGYIASYNNATKTPYWVAWRLTAEHTDGEISRPGAAFHEDPDVPMPRATNDDYRGSGWSRGHMCPAGDNKWDRDAMYESFLLTNVCPQNANLNSGVWNQIEISCRQWAVKYGELDIVCGPIYYNQEHDTIGHNKVVVPEAFFKIIICLKSTPKGIGFICKNTDGNKKKDVYVNSIQQIERITKLTFFPHMNPEIAKQVKSQADLSAW